MMIYTQIQAAVLEFDLRLTCKVLEYPELVNSEKYSRFPLCAHGSIKYLPKNI